MDFKSINRPASKPNEISKNIVEKETSRVSFLIELHGDIPSTVESQARNAFAKAARILESEWGVSTPMTIPISLMSNEKFREGALPASPATWKYCFLMRDHQPDRLYVNADIFSVLPDHAEAMIKHETAHIVIEQQVSSMSAYRKSFFLEEGTAGIDGASERLVAKLKKNKASIIPDPLSITTFENVKALGSDTNLEPFIDQLGYLALFSCVQFLRERQGEANIIKVYKRMEGEISLEDAYQEVCGESLVNAIAEWKEMIENKLLDK